MKFYILVCGKMTVQQKQFIIITETLQKYATLKRYQSLTYLKARLTYFVRGEHLCYRCGPYGFLFWDLDF